MRLARHRLLAYLRDIAMQGLVCPTNAQIAEAIGIGEVHASKTLMELRDLHRVHVERVGNRRIVTILGEGLRTADPRPQPGPTLLKPRVREITEAASAIFDVPAKDIFARSRFREHVMARQAVCFVASKRGWKPGEIGRVIGKDASTVAHNRDVVPRRVANDEDYAAQVTALMERAPLRLVQA